MAVFVKNEETISSAIHFSTKKLGTSQTVVSEFMDQDGNRQIAATGRSRTGYAQSLAIFHG